MPNDNQPNNLGLTSDPSSPAFPQLNDSPVLAADPATPATAINDPLGSVTTTDNTNAPMTSEPAADFTPLPQENTLNSMTTPVVPDTVSVLNPPPTTTSPSFTTSDSVTPPPTDGGSSGGPTITGSPHVPEKYGGKKVIATIFGVLLIVGSVFAGVSLVQRQQLLEQEAASGSNCDQDPYCELLDSPGNKGSYTAPKNISHIFITHQDYVRFDKPGKDDGCYSVLIQGNKLSWERYGSGSSCKDISNIQVWVDDTPTVTPTNGPTPTPAPTSTITPTKPPLATNTPTNKPSATPTLPPQITAECFNVVAFNENWQELSANDLSSLKAGDKVMLTVGGQTSSGTFSKARFSVNGTTIGETVNKRPSSDSFYLEYTIPSGSSSFSVKGELYHSSLGWI